MFAVIEEFAQPAFRRTLLLLFLFQVIVALLICFSQRRLIPILTIFILCFRVLSAAAAFTFIISFGDSVALRAASAILAAAAFGGAVAGISRCGIVVFLFMGLTATTARLFTALTQVFPHVHGHEQRQDNPE